MLVCLAAIATATAAPTCTAPGHSGVCLYPYQQQFKNVSVAGSKDFGAACCAVCQADARCVSWFVRTHSAKGKRAIPAGTCILNKAQVKGHAANASDCISGQKPPPTFPPTPSPPPAPAGAKNGE